MSLPSFFFFFPPLRKDLPPSNEIPLYHQPFINQCYRLQTVFQHNVLTCTRYVSKNVLLQVREPEHIEKGRRGPMQRILKTLQTQCRRDTGSSKCKTWISESTTLFYAITDHPSVLGSKVRGVTQQWHGGTMERQQKSSLPSTREPAGVRDGSYTR